MYRLLFAFIIVPLVFISIRPADAGGAPAAKWLRQHFQEYPVGGGWYVPSVWQASDGSVSITVLVPDAQAKAMMGNGKESTRRALAVICPGPKSPVWDILGQPESGFDKPLSIWVSGRERESGHHFLSVQCAR
ncbi:MAG: hypothetical protein MI920_04790 [Kiloniellales bacterium]|nr:hypothetical protein [Kiloniellales bacterium]